MFRPAPMLKVEVISLERYRDRLLTYLHEAGVVEIREADIPIAQRDAPNEFYRRAASYSITMSRIAEFLKSHLPSGKGGIKDFLFPQMPKRREYTYEGIEKLIKDTEKFLSEVEPKVKEVETRMSSINTEIERIKDVIRTLERLSAFNLDVSYLRHSGMVEVLVGSIDRNRLSSLREELENATSGKIVMVPKEEGDTVLLAIAFLSRDYNKINPILAKHSFEKIDVPEGEGTPAELIRKYSEELGKKERELEEVHKLARELAVKYYEDVKFYLELVENERNKANVLGMLARTNMTFGLTGWVPKADAEKVREGILKVTDGKAYVNFREPAKEELDEIPIKLNNPGWARPFEMLTEMYGVPKYDEIDPTPLIAFTYSFFFGFMLTDFLYGLIVGIVAALLVKGHRKFNDGTYKFSYTLLWSSFFTMLMGALFGSYFGNALDVVGAALTGNPDFQMWRIADPLRDPMFVLILALAVGLAHLFVGYTLGFIVKWKNGDRKGALLDQLPWMLVILAIALFATGKNVPAFVSSAKVLFGTGLVLFAIGEIVNNGGLAALMIISDFFGFVGTWLSYARLMALALATGGIAMVINVLVQMIWGVKTLYIGPIIGVILFFGGQIFSTAINALGAFVHSLRLHYVEFFGTFYSGEGKPFEPFKSRREVSEVTLKVENA
ncbi:V-type ATP synthase subunit I [Thermococcus gorgonarius]|uniref:A-type ATP synthase subunit I n=1 Tax=Thermococcus gorgonarius TaxID=71997 RepID=A0A2Z2M7D5_THEGO|nr:V-type ATP synthase subunit I [Thermococcus gorgonarius]ASJ01606.1 V-type ATP synthase subunit I [Thermococcus gorgonarius]